MNSETSICIDPNFPQDIPNSQRALPYSPSGWYSIPQLVERNPWATEGSIRHQIFNAKELGLTDAIMRPAGQRRVLIHEPTWLAKLQGKGK